MNTEEKATLTSKVLIELLDSMRDDRLKAFTTFVINETGDAYLVSPASRRNHHAFKGGLAFHSVMSAKLGAQIADHYNSLGIKVNRDLVVAGVLFHDIGKIFCYDWKEAHTRGDGKEVDAGYQHTSKGTMLHHIPMGCMLVNNLAAKFNLTREKDEHKIDEKKVQKLLHIVLSHHGRRAWSSPVLPQFVEAFIVHSIEMLDGYVDKFEDGNVPDTIYDGVNY